MDKGKKGRRKYMRRYRAGSYKEKEKINSCEWYSLGKEVKAIRR